MEPEDAEREVVGQAGGGGWHRPRPRGQGGRGQRQLHGQVHHRHGVTHRSLIQED